MDESADAQVDPHRVRIGLAIVTVIVLAALVMVAVVDDPLGRSVMLAVVVLGFVRAFLLTRSLRRDARS